MEPAPGNAGERALLARRITEMERRMDMGDVNTQADPTEQDQWTDDGSEGSEGSQDGGDADGEGGRVDARAGPPTGTASEKARCVLNGAAECLKDASFGQTVWVSTTMACMAVLVWLLLRVKRGARRAAVGLGLCLVASAVPLCAEAANTALERAVDRVSPLEHEKSRAAKDASCFAVFLADVLAVAVYGGALAFA